MNKQQKVTIQRDWLSKILSGTFLGFTLATVCAGVFLKLTPDIASQIKVQLSMWLVIPIWMLVLGCSFFFRKGSHAWLGLLAANILIYALYKILPDIQI